MRRSFPVSAVIAVIAVVAAVAATPAVEAKQVNATIRFDPDRQAGTDGEGRVLVFTPKPLAPGSSISHFDVSAFPNLLMEPSVSSDLPVGEVDLTQPAMRDFGWPRGSFESRIVYTDRAGVGFNDPQLGDARRAAFEFAVGRWQGVLGSAVPVGIDASFAPFECSPDGGVLAKAGPDFAFRDFPGSDPGVVYPGPLAEALAGQNLSSEDATDLSIFFNTEIDEGCLGAGSSYYYGTDDNRPAGQISFVSVAMHEMAHGLGFTSLVDAATGEQLLGSPDSYTRLLYDSRVDKHWGDMSDAQRRKSAIRPGKVSLDGERTTAAADNFLGGSDALRVNRPKSLSRDYVIAPAVFGPPPSEAGVTADLALVADASTQPGLGCEELVDPEEVAGKIAVVDRGDCFFTVKVKNAQDAGALAVIVVNNVGGPPVTMGGDDDTVDIPAVQVSRKDGRKLKRRLRK